MSNLVAEILLRLAKAIAATLLGIVVFLVATGMVGASPTVELALLSWLVAAGFILLVESSPL